MFFIIPKEVDVPQARIPFVNWLIIALIILVFAFQVKTLLDYKVQREKEQQDRSISTQTQEQKQAEKPSLVDKFEPFFLDGWELKGIFGHMWLHAGFFHIAGNLLFLWVFGNAVCSKVGNFTYLLFYLCVGVFAAAAHLVFSGGTAIGASGAINGIVGMFLIFFP